MTESEESNAEAGRREALRQGVVVHQLGIDPWQHALDALAAGYYIQFVVNGNTLAGDVDRNGAEIQDRASGTL